MVPPKEEPNDFHHGGIAMKKRFLSILTALTLCLTLLPTAAFAAAGVWDGQIRQVISGTGTAEKPFEIETPQQLAGLAQATNDKGYINGGKLPTTCYVKLMNDIILNDCTFDASGNLPDATIYYWMPINGKECAIHFDGNHHSISGLCVTDGNIGYFYSGLFGYLKNGSIKNLTIKSSLLKTKQSASATDYSGIFAGRAYNAAFENCTGENNIVISSGATCGGIVGYIAGGRLVQSSNSGTISGEGRLGGLCGQANGTTIQNCWNCAEVAGDENGSESGGILAYANSNVNLYNCCNLAGVFGESRTGGVCGEASSSIIKNCYTRKDVSGGWNYVGAFLGCFGSNMTVDLSYVEAGSQLPNFGAYSGGDSRGDCVTKFTGTGGLGGGSDTELLNALNENLYRMDGADGLKIWAAGADGYPLPIGDSFVDTSKYYDIWLDGVRVSDHNQSDILGNGLASYDEKSNTLTFKNGLVVTKAYRSRLLYSKNDLNISVQGTVKFLPDSRSGGNPSIIDLDAGKDLTFKASGSEQATVIVQSSWAEYGISARSLTLDGNIALMVETGQMPMAISGGIIMKNSSTAMINVVDTGKKSAAFYPFSTVIREATPAQKLYEDQGDGLVKVETFTTERDVDGELKSLMYPHIRIAPEVYGLADNLPTSLIVSMEDANEESALVTWVSREICNLEGITTENSTVSISSVTPAVAGTHTAPSGTYGSFVASVTLTRDGVSLTQNIPGVITATVYTAPTISTTFRVGTVNGTSGIFEEKIDKTFTCGEEIVFAVTYTSNSTAVQNLTGTVTCFDKTKDLTWSEDNSCYLSPVEASSCFTCPTVKDYTASYTIGGTGEYEQKTDNLSLTVEGLTLKASDFSFSPPSDLVYDGNAKTASLQFNGNPKLSVTPVVKYYLNGSPVSEAKVAGVYTVELDVGVSSYYKPVTDLSDSSWTFTIVKPSATIDLLPNANDLTYNGLPQELVTPGSSAGGTLRYSTSENGSYTSSIPTGTVAGDYIVYWYVQGDDAHSDSDKQHIEVKIKAKNLDSSDVSTDQIAAQAYSGSDLMPETRVKDGGTCLSVGHDYTLAYENNKFVGTAAVKITGIGNYTGEIATNFTIIPKQLTALDFSGITVTKIYDSTTEAGTLTGTVGFNGKVSTDDIFIKAIPSMYADANVGTNKTVTLALSLEGGNSENYTLAKEDATYEFTAASITKADGRVTAPKRVDELRYNGKMQTLVTGGSSTTGEIQYRLGESRTYGTTLPQAKDAGSYTVYYKVVGDSNHKDVEEKFVTLEIKAAELTVTAKDKNAYIGGKAPDLSKPELNKDYTVDGLIGKDHLTKEPILAYDPAMPDMTKIGEAAKIIANGADAGSNYSITYAAGKLILSRRSSSRGSVTYPVNVPDKTENGSVTVSPKNASAGSTVTITVKPDSGYVLETISVTDKNGNDLKLTNKGNGKYTFTMPGSKVEVKATFMEDNSVLNFFYDVSNDAYYYEAVKWAVENGITGGVGSSLFAPNQPCTRAQIVTFLWRAAGSPEPKNMSNFSDVPADSYYAKAVAWAVENGITTGTGDGKFGPDATCTRAQSVTFLFRASKASANGAPAFSDVAATAYYAEAVKWATNNGITNGIGDNLFGSDNDCTRAQIVTFLYRMYQEN